MTDPVKLELGEEKNEQEGSTQPTQSDKDVVALAIKRAKAYQDYHSDNIATAEDNNSFIVQGEQWTKVGNVDVKKERENDGLPCLTFNRAPGFVGRHVGKMLKSLPRAKAVGIDSKSDPELGRIVTEIGRKVRRQSRASRIYGQTIKQVMTSGFPSYRRIITDYVDDGSFEQEIYIQWIPYQFSVALDPNATAFDTPARGGPKWGMILEDILPAEFARRYPKAHTKSIEDIGSEEERNSYWMEKDKVRIAEYFYAEPFKVKILSFVTPDTKKTINIDEKSERHAQLIARYPGIAPVKDRTVERYKIKRCIISGYEILEPAEDWMGKYIPIIPTLPKTSWVKGKQVFEGLYQWAKDAGRMRNYWASALTSNVALSEAPPYIATNKQIAGNRKDWANPKGLRVITFEVDPAAPNIKPSRESPATISQGEVTMLQLAIDEEKALCSTYDASLGNRSNETAGVAIEARDAQSDDAQFEFEDNLAASIEYEEMILIDLYPKVYDTHRIFRIYGEDGRDQGTIEVNQPSGEMLPDDITGELVQKLVNDLSMMRYDVEVQTGPGPSSKRTETAQILSQLAQGNPALQAIVTPSIMRSLDFEESDLVAELAEATLSPEMREIIQKKRNKGKPDAQADGQAAIQQAVEAVRQEAAQELQLSDQKMMEMQKQIEQLSLAAKDKSRELDLKEQELALKAREMQAKQSEEMEKVAGDVRIAEIEAQKEVDVATIQAQAEIVKQEIGTPVPVAAPEKPEQEKNLTVIIDNKSGTVRKTISLIAPSGQKYTGEVTEQTGAGE